MDSVQRKLCFVFCHNQRSLVGSCTPKASVGRVSVDTIGRYVGQVLVDVLVNTQLRYRPSMLTCRLTSVAARSTRLSDDTRLAFSWHYIDTFQSTTTSRYCHLAAPFTELHLLYSNVNLFSLALRNFLVHILSFNTERECGAKGGSSLHSTEPPGTSPWIECLSHLTELTDVVLRLNFVMWPSIFSKDSLQINLNYLRFWVDWS